MIKEKSNLTKMLREKVSQFPPFISGLPRNQEIKTLLKEKKFWVSLAAILILAGSGVYFAATRIAAKKAAQDSEPAIQTAVARTGELVVMASGAGKVIASSEINMAFEDDGTVIELNVHVGDKVQKGEILAKLQTKNTAESIQAAIASANLAVTQAQNALDLLHTNAAIDKTTALSDIATYAQAVRDAQWQFDNYLVPDNLQGLDPIEALDKMKKELDAARSAFEPYKFETQDNSTRTTLLEAYNRAQSDYNSAVKRLDYVYQLEVAEANLNKARQEYDSYKDGPAATDLAEAKEKLALAEAQLASAKETKSILELIAPWDGTVLDITADVGEYLGTTSFLTLANLDHPILDVSLDETDMDKIIIGYPAEVTFDALPDQIFTGTVTIVDPSLETVSNVQTVKALVELDQSQLKEGLTLPIGLSAAVDIIAGRAENAVLVPVEALREISPGEYAVFVMKNGELKLRVVTVGLMDVTTAQILTGLEPGEIVSTGVVQTGQGQ